MLYLCQIIVFIEIIVVHNQLRLGRLVMDHSLMDLGQAMYMPDHSLFEISCS